MKYIRNFAEHTKYEAEMSKIPTPSVSYCRKENECHFMPNNVIMFKVGDLNGNTNQTVTVNYYEGGSETIPITEGNKWYVFNVPSGKSLTQLNGIREITDTIISAKINVFYSSILNGYYGNVRFVACDFSGITHMSNMFQSCGGLKTLDVSNWDVSNVTNMYSMFDGCSSLQNLDLNNWDVSNVTNMSSMFNGCTSLQNLDLNNWNVSSVTNMYCMFGRCTKLQELNISGWDVSNVTDMSYMFNSCGKLNTIYMRNCSQTTIDKIKAQLKTDGILNNVTIITE